jgi:protein involved in polysaccharide export with SLBB domain
VVRCRRPWRRHAALIPAVGALAACSAACGPPPELPGTRVAAGGRVSPSGQGVEGYRLGSGDEVRVTVFGHENLSGEFQVDGLGNLSLPLVDSVEVGGLTAPRAEEAIAEVLARGYLIDPQVSVEVLGYRPFYTLGEVESPGSYPYVSGMTVLNAVALAGGFTYRTDEDGVCLSRGPDRTFEAGGTTRVLPGDVIQVGERWF